MGLLNEYINKNMGSQDLQNELLRLISEYNKLTGSYLFVYAAALNKAIPDAAVIMDDYFIIHDMLKDVSVKNLDVYVETPGGSGETVEEIVRFFRNKFEKVSFVVSGEAKSAGTILVLSGDEISMTNSGSLGPIDAQVRFGRTPQISAYDYMEWVKNKQEEAIKNGKLNPFDAIMISQISPGELNGVYHSLEFAKDLICQWLPKYKFKNWTISSTTKTPITQQRKEARAKEIAEELVNHSKWRSHGRSLKIADLESLLKINNIDCNPALSDIVYRIQTVLRMIFSSSTTFKIFANDKEKIFRNALPPNTMAPNFPMQVSPDVLELQVKCQKCGIDHKFYAKFKNNPKIDIDYQKKGMKPFPQGNRFACVCNFVTDLTPLRNQVENDFKKKIVF